MEPCILCDRKAGKRYDIASVTVCSRCYSRLHLDRLKNVKVPSDDYALSLVEEENIPYVNALNLLSTIQPKRAAKDFFGIFLTNVDDEEMSQFFIISMILAARSVWLHGNKWMADNGKDAKKPVYEFHQLGNIVGIAIMAKVARDRDDLDIENIDDMEIMNHEINLKMIEILENLQEHDDGTLCELVIATIALIRHSTLFK